MLGRSWVGSCMACLLLVVAFRFACGGMGIWWGVRVSRGIVRMIVKFHFAFYVFINSKTKLKALSCSVTREATRIYHVY